MLNKRVITMPQESKKLAKESAPDAAPNDTVQFATRRIPDEILVRILRHVGFKTLLSCQLVCKHWLRTITNHVWRAKAQEVLMTPNSSGALLPIDDSISWLQYYYVWMYELPLGRNLVANHSGKRQFKNWAIVDTTGKLDKWIVEEPPVGVPALPDHPVFEGQNCCFSASSTSVCNKYQVVDLIEEGFSRHVLDNVRPVIRVSEWHCRKQDCYAYYTWKIQLIGERGRLLQEYEWKVCDTDSDSEWKRCTKELRYSGPGLRKILFAHRCEESKFSPVTFAICGATERTQLYQPVDRYGAKLAGACVELLIPNSLNAKQRRYESPIVLKSASSVAHLQRPVRLLRL